MIDRMSELSRQALELAQEEADRLGHVYLGSEHLLLGLLRQSDTAASRTLIAAGLDLETTRSGIESLIAQRRIPGPQRGDAELLRALGVDLARVRNAVEEAFGQDAVGEATWRVSRRLRRRRGPRPTPLCGRPLLFKRALAMAREQADASGEPDVSPQHLLLGLLRVAEEPVGVDMSRRGRKALAQLHLTPGLPNPVKLLVEAQGLTLQRLRELAKA